ncbi:hypothetical protein DH2020_007534 [Rehmannia glutinosa]|uniref:Uncharacterized protein n=1 Tax=Rehmannia glutinosa TaxID=99300 RepID=A0ABR0TYD1_REHGL
MAPSLILSPILLLLLLLLHPSRNILTRAAEGKWDLLQPNIGISAMHMQLLHTDRVVIFDRTDFGFSNISLPDGKCRHDPKDTATPIDCTAHSVEYDVASNSIRPLMVLTDVWCSSGAVMPNGTLVQAGGFNDGDHAVRMLKPCRDKSCDWQEINNGLTQRRWYATSQILPDGRQIIIGGRRQFNYEFYPKTSSDDGSYNLPFLVQTNDPRIENNLYPFVFLNVDGNLFIFANNRAILFDYKNGKVDNVGAEVLVCGGAPKGAFAKANNGQFVGALNTCGRIRINDLNPQWVMETMPMGRVMGDMVLLPNGNVLIVNGAGTGTAGWEFGRNPVLSPVIYRRIIRPVEIRSAEPEPHLECTTRPPYYFVMDEFLLVAAILILITTLLSLISTDLTTQSFSPSYLDPKLAYLRPRIISPVSQSKIGYGQQVPIRFTIPTGRLDSDSVMVTMVAPSFTTHSFSMNQRLLILTRADIKVVGRSTYQIRVTTPGSGNLAPSGYYLIFVVHRDIPSEGIWVQII